MAVPRWQPGRLYQTGVVVQDVSSGALASQEVTNPGFEAGDTDWFKSGGWTIENVSGLQGNWRAKFVPSSGTKVLVSDDRRAVDAGITKITAEAFILTSGDLGIGRVGIHWFSAGLGFLKADFSTVLLSGARTAYRKSSVTARAPAGAAFAALAVQGDGSVAGDVVFADSVTWNYARLTPVSEVIFKAIQAAAGFSGTSEPVWPTVIGNTVVDNGVTWEAVQANRVVWTCSSLLTSGSAEPTFPTEIGGVVVDNDIGWEAFSRRVEDVNCPNTKQVAILASKVFSGDDDIVGFSATVNPLDWTTRNDAGYIPFGLNTYGSQPVSALGIYRSNLVIWNSKAFQMWQVDEDPANFAILDAIPVGNPFYKSASPVNNDLVFLTSEGIRSMGIAGASTNLQAGFFGKQIDPLVKAALAGLNNNDDVISLFFPGGGQYWLIFGAEAFVLTMNGGKADMSWSRYVFPSAIDDFTIKDTDLYLRSGDKVWRVDEDTLIDDSGGANVAFEGRVWWPYLDFGALGVTKSLIGFDVVADGSFTVSFGYNQKDDAQFTAPYSIVGDTLVGDVIPLPVSAPSLQLRLVFPGGDSNFANVVFLGSFNGADGATTAVDESPSANLITFVGDAEITTDQARIGDTSLGVNNSTLPDVVNDAVKWPITNADFDFGAGDWTIEFFYRADESAGANAMLSIGTTGVNQEMLNILLSNGSIAIEWIDNGLSTDNQVFTVPHINSTWHHVAMQRKGNDLRCWFNGVESSTGTQTMSITLVDPTGFCMLGGSQDPVNVNQEFEGYIDEVRITKGVARYTGDFTSPAVASPTLGINDWKWSATALHLQDFRKTS